MAGVLSPSQATPIASHRTLPHYQSTMFHNNKRRDWKPFLSSSNPGQFRHFRNGFEDLRFGGKCSSYILRCLIHRDGRLGSGIRRPRFMIPKVVRRSNMPPPDGNENVRKGVQIGLWVMEGVYILWLFLLPYAPGDPVWAISPETVNSLVGLSLNFFFILPLMNAVGIHILEAPVLHPMSEGLFNFVLGWTLMFAPLLFTDTKRDRYTGSLDVLWGLQMFLTNTFLIPYMAIRLNEADPEDSPREPSQLSSVMINGAAVVGLVGGLVCVISLLWALFGRSDSNFGSLGDRWDFLVSYLSTERLAYAFIWDIFLYTIFQPWLIGSNLQNVEDSKVGAVNVFRFVPVVGLVAYLICLDKEGE